jgi:hypothetical protein
MKYAIKNLPKMPYITDVLKELTLQNKYRVTYDDIYGFCSIFRGVLEEINDKNDTLRFHNKGRGEYITLRREDIYDIRRYE